jgi:hypothetical protein
MVRKRRGYNQYEARLIQLLRWRFEKAKLKVQDHLKVGKLPLEIDLIVNYRAVEKIKGSVSIPQLFEYFRRYNIMEVKTEQDPLALGDLLKLQAYTWLYMEKHEIYSITEVTATAIVHHLTSTVMEALPALGYRPVDQGIFRCDSALASYLISIEDLPDELVPEELQVFSNPKRRQRVFLSCFGKEEKKPILDTLFDLCESEVLKLMALYNVKPESMPKYIKALGKEKVLAAISKEDHLSALSKKDLLSALSKKDLLSALSEEDIIAVLRGKEHLLKSYLASLRPKQRQKVLAQIRQDGASKRRNSKSRGA